MWKWLIAGVVVATAAVAIAVMMTRDGTRDGTRDADRVIEDFRAVERASIAAFNSALRRQRANEIDELELAAIVERDVLVPWRAMRARVAAAPGTDELYVTLKRYVDARQTAWEAYAAGLRASTDEAARPHFDAYHQKNAEAQEDAKALGRMFRDR